MDFSCDECGGCAINLPEGLDDNASVVCHRCGKALCTWAEFKERTHQVLTEGGRKLKHEPAGSQTTTGTDVHLPDKPRVLAFIPFSPKGQDRGDKSQPLRPVSDLRRVRVEARQPFCIYRHAWLEGIVSKQRDCGSRSRTRVISVSVAAPSLRSGVCAAGALAISRPATGLTFVQGMGFAGP